MSEAAVTYRYLGDGMTEPALRGARCEAVRRPDGKCIRGRNGNMLVSFAGRRVVVLARHLRKIKEEEVMTQRFAEIIAAYETALAGRDESQVDIMELVPGILDTVPGSEPHEIAAAL